MGRTTNMIALPPFVVDAADGKRTQMPLARWKQEMDMGVKSKMYRKELPTEILMPVFYGNQWLLLIWDFARRIREALSFKDLVIKEQ
jgi:hypothetical protein